MQSVTADFYEEEHRGRAFGTLHLTSAAGAALGGLYATNMGECACKHRVPCTVICQHIAGMIQCASIAAIWLMRATPAGATHLSQFEGWRLAFSILGFISLAIGLANFAFSKDPRVFDGHPPSATQPGRQSGLKMFMAALKDIKSVITVPTFAIIITQVSIYMTMTNLTGFLTKYLCSGITTTWCLGTRNVAAVCNVAGNHRKCAWHVACLSHAVPSAAGGFKFQGQPAGVADDAGTCWRRAVWRLARRCGFSVAAKCWSHHRLPSQRSSRCETFCLPFGHHNAVIFRLKDSLCSTVLLSSGAIMTATILKGLPHENASAFFAAYVAVFMANGALNAWPAPACNNPIFAG